MGSVSRALLHHENNVVLLPSSLIIGIVAFFSYPLPISWYALLVGVLVALLIAIYLSCIFTEHRFFVGILPAMMIVGFLCAYHCCPDYQSKSVDLVHARSFINVAVTGEIENIIYGNRSLLVLSKVIVNNHHHLDGLVQFRLSHRYVNVIYALRCGQRIQFRGNIYHRKVATHRYHAVDFNRIYGINMYGYVNYINPLHQSRHHRYSYKNILDSLRSSIMQKIIQRDYNKNGAALVLALTVGTTGYMSHSDLYNVRKSGFAHLLAISGLHMGVVIGTIFILIRLLLIRINYIHLYYDAKKISALCTVFVGIFYLSLTNLSVSVIRSFTMFIVSMIGILLDKKSTSIRSWSFAAMMIAVLMPEKIFTPSFQMSFMASLALIALYQRSHSTYIIVPELLGYRYSIVRYLGAIFFSSNVATIATLFFEIYHFKQYTIIGLLSNAVAIPMVEFCMLPLCIIGIVTMPLGLDYYFFWLASKAGQLLCLLAAYCANSTWGCFNMTTMPIHCILLHSFGLITVFSFWSVFFCRVLGIAVVLLGIGLHWWS